MRISDTELSSGLWSLVKQLKSDAKKCQNKLKPKGMV